MRELYIGLLSGTSMDAADAALLDLGQLPPRLLAAQAVPYPAPLRTTLQALARGEGDDIDRTARADRALGRLFAEAAHRLLDEAGVTAAEVTAIGSHGQTLRHHPDGADAYTVQIGDPNTIAHETGITTVADFRRRDLAAGGQGAPLVPAFHAACFRSASEDRALLNLGGIANLTLLPAIGAVTGFDTGPANTLLDGWAARHLGRPLDAGGEWAATGRVVPTLLERLRGDGYFERAAPKSTGPEHFHADWLDARLAGVDAEPADVQATLVALTAATVADGLRRALPDATRLLVCGGGVHNRTLLAALREALVPLPVASTAEYGLDPDWVEAAAFAWLARETLAGRAGNVPEVTGAVRPVVLGGIYLAG